MNKKTILIINGVTVALTVLCFALGSMTGDYSGAAMSLIGAGMAVLSTVFVLKAGIK